MTRQEYDANAPLRHAAAELLRTWFPLSYPLDGAVGACAAYRSVWGVGVWSHAKWWNGTRSGWRAHLDFLEFPALVLSGHLREHSIEVVVSAPASEFSPDKPARASVRLAHRAAEMSSIEFCDLLAKDSEKHVVARPETAPALADRRAAIIDDQTTTGATLSRAKDAAVRVGMDPAVLMSWSHSHAPDSWLVLHDVFGCWLEETFPSSNAPRLTCRQRQD